MWTHSFFEHIQNVNNLMLEPIKFFSVYSKNDREHLKEIKNNLASLIRKKEIDFWHDQEIAPGEPWEIAIRKQLESANIIILFVSSDFLGSEFIHSKELPIAFKRKGEGEVEIIPIIVRPCSWEVVDNLKRLQVLPTGLKPIVEWKPIDRGYKSVSDELIKIIDKLRIKIADSNGFDFEKIRVNNPELLYDFLIRKADRLQKEERSSEALRLYKKAKKINGEKFSPSLDELNFRIEKCEYNIEIISGLNNTSLRKYKEALNNFNAAKKKYSTGFVPELKNLEKLINECEAEILKIEAASLFSIREIKQALEKIEKGLSYDKENQGLKNLKEQIQSYLKKKNKFEEQIKKANTAKTEANWESALENYKKSFEYLELEFRPDKVEISKEIDFCIQKIERIRELKGTPVEKKDNPSFHIVEHIENAPAPQVSPQEKEDLTKNEYFEEQNHKILLEPNEYPAIQFEAVAETQINANVQTKLSEQAQLNQIEVNEDFLVYKPGKNFKNKAKQLILKFFEEPLTYPQFEDNEERGLLFLIMCIELIFKSIILVVIAITFYIVVSLAVHQFIYFLNIIFIFIPILAIVTIKSYFRTKILSNLISLILSFASSLFILVIKYGIIFNNFFEKAPHVNLPIILFFCAALEFILLVFSPLVIPLSLAKRITFNLEELRGGSPADIGGYP